MNYKVGDKVRVRENLEADEDYGATYANGEMTKYKTLTIKEVHSEIYDVEENSWGWTDEMLEPPHRTIKDIQYGDVLTDGNEFVYILSIVDEVVLLGLVTDTIKYAKEADYSDTYSIKAFVKAFKDWKIVGQEEEVVEMTLEEIAKLKGIDVKRLKIKK